MQQLYQAGAARPPAHPRRHGKPLYLNVYFGNVRERCGPRAGRAGTPPLTIYGTAAGALPAPFGAPPGAEPVCSSR